MIKSRELAYKVDAAVWYKPSEVTNCNDLMSSMYETIVGRLANRFTDGGMVRQIMDELDKR